MSRFLYLFIFTLLTHVHSTTQQQTVVDPALIIHGHDDNTLHSRLDQPSITEYVEEFLPIELIPPMLKPSTLTPPPHFNTSTSTAQHTFHTTQSTNTWSFELMTQTAPWSARIQPALLYQQKEITYRRWDTGLQVSTGDDWLLFYEGSLSYTGLLQNNSELANENDVWASMDDGQTWDLIAGVSRRGTSGPNNPRSAWGTQAQSFIARGGSNNCEDPASDDIYSIAGYRYFGLGNAQYTTGQVWRSTDAKRWTSTGGDSFQPTRYFSSCDVDVNGHVFSMGGLNINPQTGAQTLLRDVWHTAQGGWTRATATAGWAARAEHLTMIASDTPLNKEIIYVIGGYTQYEPQTSGDIRMTMANDVWASSDQGVTWLRLSEGPFYRRWGHGGLVTKAGVLIVFGGSNTDTGMYSNMYSYRDVWTSFDGGYTWRECQLPSGDDTARQFIRTEQGVTVDGRGRMIIASGYSFDPSIPYGRYDYRDVWRTPFSVEDTDTLASMCGGASVIPRAGVGLRRWGTLQPTTTSNSFIMYPQTHRAPWSNRIQPAFLHMEKAVTYTQVGTGVKRSTGPNWLLMYEGSLTYTTNFVSTNENDVWASLDMGATWDLIAGITRNGSRGYVEAVNSTRSFSSRGGSNNCEDPTSDDVFSIGGLAYIPGTNQSYAVNDVWYSTDAITWTLQTGSRSQSFSPARYFSSCDIDDHGVMYVMGGVQPPTTPTGQNKLLNDVWQGNYKGREWVRVDSDDSEHWSARAEHQVLQWHSPTLRKDLIYVMGGMTTYDVRGLGNTRTINDVWVTSDGGVSWTQLAGPEIDNENGMWSRRWGHAAVITAAGVIVVAGGTDSYSGQARHQVTKKDMWVSWDGGINWQECHLCPSGSTRAPCNPEFIRTEMAAQLTSDEHLLLSTGYTHYNNSLRTGYSDVWQSAISLADHDALSRVCGGAEYIPSAGTGLRKWPSVAPTPTPKVEGSMSGAAIAGIVFAILVVVAVLGFVINTYKKTGKLPFMGGDSGSNGGGETSTTDYSAFAFATDNKDTAAASTNGTNGTGEHNSQYLS